MNEKLMTDRRTMLKGSAWALGAAALSATPFAGALAAKFPSDPLKIMVATREGGGADRLLRAFWFVWKKYLKANAETSFYPGAAGRVGYQKYMGMAKPDCYTLLFGNMGPEVLNWVVQPPTPVNRYRLVNRPPRQEVVGRYTARTVDCDDDHHHPQL